MTEITINVPPSLLTEVTARAEEEGDSLQNVIVAAIADVVGKQHATIFQISTTNALVEGVHGKAVTIRDLRAHGNFGLGTFAGLAGEMVVVDGTFMCVPGNGAPYEAQDADEVPFAVVSVFTADATFDSGPVGRFSDLAAVLDSRRGSENLFYAVRISGRFDSIHTRAVCPVPPGTGLVAAAHSQTELHSEGVSGTIVGYWFPEYSSALNVPGWHLHFITDDRSAGGHVLDVESETLNVALQQIDDLHVSLPETKEFMQANLNFDPEAALDEAERAH
ncbi:MAG: acetolactate decarboxylase [Actinobacteria bacterium]|nr:acetolactate decarboxylase [Actinomycetota bacterium]